MSAFILTRESSDALPYLEQSRSVGIDTEFMRERTYFAELCLVQVAAGDAILCVDPLLNDDQSAFWQALATLDWTVHSGRQDLEVIFQSARVMPTSLFDTQVAAALVGHAPQLGYAGLVKTLFDVELPKSHTRANWAERPLPEALLEYAAEDVEYLGPARAALEEELERLGRLDWAIADSALLLDERLYAADPASAVGRLKGARNLRGERRRAAVLLAGWREDFAIQRNKPRQWILRDNVLIEIAHSLPTSMKALRAVEGLPPRVLQRHSETLLELVTRAREGDDSGYVPPRPPSEAEKKLLKQMQQRVAAAAEALGLANEIVASRKELSAAIHERDTSSRVFTDWRREIVGEELLSMIG